RPSHFLFARAKEKVTKEKARPTSGSGLRPDFPRSGAAPGAVTKGRPCPFVPRSASMPRVPLRNTSTRPPDGDRGPSCLEDRSDSPGLRFLLHEPTDDINAPFRRVSAIVAQRGEPQGCGESRKGPGMALV